MARQKEPEHTLDALIFGALDANIIDDVTAFRATRQLKPGMVKSFTHELCHNSIEMAASMIYVAKVYRKQLQEVGLDPEPIYQLQSRFRKDPHGEETREMLHREE